MEGKRMPRRLGSEAIVPYRNRCSSDANECHISGLGQVVGQLHSGHKLKRIAASQLSWASFCTQCEGMVLVLTFLTLFMTGACAVSEIRATEDACTKIGGTYEWGIHPVFQRIKQAPDRFDGRACKAHEQA